MDFDFLALYECINVCHICRLPGSNAVRLYHKNPQEASTAFSRDKQLIMIIRPIAGFFAGLNGRYDLVKDTKMPNFIKLSHA